MSAMGNPDDVRPTPAAELEVLLEQWVLDDGNYPQFKARRTKRFALQLDLADSHRLRPAPGEPLGARRTGGAATYDITADVVHHTKLEDGAEGDHAVVFDFGPRAFYRGDDPAVGRLRVGDRVTFKATLLVDPYDYIEILEPLEDFPALVYTWSVDRLQADHPAGSRDGWQDRPRTSNNLRDLYVDTTYLLTCTDTGETPTRQRRR